MNCETKFQHVSPFRHGTWKQTVNCENKILKIYILRLQFQKSISLKFHHQCRYWAAFLWKTMVLMTNTFLKMKCSLRCTGSQGLSFSYPRGKIEFESPRMKVFSGFQFGKSALERNFFNYSSMQNFVQPFHIVSSRKTMTRLLDKYNRMT